MTTPAPAGRFADSVYDHNAPSQQRAGYAYNERPGYNSNEERLVSQALAAQQNVDPELLRTMRPSAVTNLFPPRFGYDRTVLGIRDVVQVNRRYPDSSAQFSGLSGSYTSMSGPSLGVW